MKNKPTSSTAPPVKGCKRCLLLVIDGLGVGQMPDVAYKRPQDCGANTLLNIIKTNPKIKLRNFQKIGSLDYFLHNKFTKKKFQTFYVSLGKSALMHYGADTFLGHQELIGTKPKQPKRQFVRLQKDKIIKKLRQNGFKAKFEHKVVIVEKHMAVADNLETDYGLNINVVGSLDHYPYATITKVGKIVRSLVQVSRVITMGGTNICKNKILDCFEIQKKDGFTAHGINIPKLNIYNDQYQVIHMGYGIDPTKQLPHQVLEKNIKTTLIGKAADIIEAKKATYLPEVRTKKVLQLIYRCLKYPEPGLIIANIQQTDLSGHEQSVKKYSQQLEIVDKSLPKILKLLNKNDLFIITADHGNDPTIGHSHHTREFTPIILFSHAIKSHNLGQQPTLSNTAATIAQFYKSKLTENGTPYLKFT